MQTDLNPELTLASRSPRRRELLCQIGVKFNVVDIEIDEQSLPEEDPQDYVQRLAVEKMRAGKTATSAELPVLGADTIVLVENRILGKPQTTDAALDMLCTLSDRTHEVISAVALGREGDEASRVATTQVTFRALSEAECLAYIATGEPMDKAGAYGIQGFAGLFVAKIEGSYSNVVGLPLFETAELLKNAGISVWNPRV